MPREVTERSRKYSRSGGSLRCIRIKSFEARFGAFDTNWPACPKTSGVLGKAEEICGALSKKVAVLLLTNARRAAIIRSIKYDPKPLSKSSSMGIRLKESCGWWNRGRRTGVNGLMRASERES